jgi:hypothetical protein
MNGLFEAAQEAQQFMQTRLWSFCFIGGIAVIRWGEVRMTQDVDLTLFTGFGDEKPYIRELLGNFQSRIADAEHFALRYRVLLLVASNGTPLDITLAGLPFEQQMIERASPFAYASDCDLLTCSAEDLIVLKAFANRVEDWMDVEGIVIRQDAQLDVEYIIEQLAPFCELKEQPEILEKLHQILDQVKPQ